MQQPTHDVIIRGGLVVDGTGAPARPGDIAIDGDRITSIVARDHAHEGVAGTAHLEIDATDRIVTPGFIDVHTHLDAQLAWDPIASPSSWHGVTSVVVGNCGLGLAPCRPDDRTFVAEMLESVEGIPADVTLDALAWDWETFDGYLESLDRTPKGVNVGGLVGHSALRLYAMGERALSDTPATDDDIAAMTALLDEAMAAGALGVSTSRTDRHQIPDGRPIPGTFATHDELLAFADVLREHGVGVFEGAMRLRERDTETYERARREIELLGEISRRSGQPATFGLQQTDTRPGLVSTVIDFVTHENEREAVVRPQTTARGVGVLYTIDHRTPFDAAPSWRELLAHRNGKKLTMLRDASFRQQLITEADEHGTDVDLDRLFVMPFNEGARYDCDPEWSLAAVAHHRGVSPAAAFIELAIESDGDVVAMLPTSNRDLRAVETMLEDPVVAVGLSEAGAHVEHMVDAGQPTFLLSYWVRERERWSLEEGVRRLTSDPADLFGLRNRGRLAPGAQADVNVIDIDALQLHRPEFVDDFPAGPGRFIQRATGYEYTLVNGRLFMEAGEHTGALHGRVLRSTP